jgi:hypothetical protein
MHGDSLRVFENTLSALNCPTKRKPHTNNRSHQRPPSISSPSPSDALTSAHTPTPSNTPPPHTTHHNSATTDDTPISMQNYAPPTNNAATPQKPSPHDTHSNATQNSLNNHSNKPSLSYAPSAITICADGYRRNTCSSTTRAPRASDTSAGETHTPRTLPCESTTRCRLRPFTFLPPSYPRAPPPFTVDGTR